MASENRNQDCQDAIDDLATLIPYGHLLSCTDVEVFLVNVATEIRRLRAALRHAHYRDHEHSPRSCSACEGVEKVIREIDEDDDR